VFSRRVQRELRMNELLQLGSDQQSYERRAGDTTMEIPMKHLTFVSAIAAVVALGSNMTAIAQESKALERVEQDNRDIRRDNRDIRRDRVDLKTDAAKLKEERAERNTDLRKEERAIEHGNLKAAEKYDARRRQEQKEINGIKKDIRTDKADLSKDKADRRHDIAKRNKNAGKL
jgi:hypothetical protein